jgi:hypothetical protein
MPKEDCFASLKTYANRVREVRAELAERKGLDVKHVLMTSDERDPAWWADVRAMGWSFIDYKNEPKDSLLGSWKPIVIDGVVQSMAIGMVGTARSTVSLIAVRRVQSWNDGSARFVNWGSPGIDEESPIPVSKNIAD